MILVDESVARFSRLIGKTWDSENELDVLARQYSSKDAAVLGSYLHGRSADLAVKNSTEESLLATDVIEHLSQAIKEIKTN